MLLALLFAAGLGCGTLLGRILSRTRKLPDVPSRDDVSAAILRAKADHEAHARSTGGAFPGHLTGRALRGRILDDLADRGFAYVPIDVARARPEV